MELYEEFRGVITKAINKARKNGWWTKRLSYASVTIAAYVMCLFHFIILFCALLSYIKHF